MNSTDWTTNSSCFIKYIAEVSLYGETASISSITLDKFDFNFNGQYCDPPINYAGNEIYTINERVIDENTVGGKFNLNIDFFVLNWFYHLLFQVI